MKLATAPLTQVILQEHEGHAEAPAGDAGSDGRYKDDQVAMQKETMELYKRHRINPVSGCLPMMLQLPIFVGLYNALLHSIDCGTHPSCCGSTTCPPQIG